MSLIQGFNETARKIISVKFSPLILLIVSGSLIATNSVPLTKVFAATNYYVATNGSDNNPGTQSQPFLTIAHASTVATAGSTVHVAAGTYNFTELITSSSGTSGSPITYVSDTPLGAKLVGTGADRVWEVEGSYNTIKAFDITGTYSSNRLGILTYGNYEVINNNYVHDIGTNYCATGAGGIDLSNTSKYVNPTYDTVDSNLLNRIGPASGTSLFKSCGNLDQGVYVSTPNNTVQNNVVNVDSGFCIHLYHNPNYNIVANNTVDQCGQSGIIVGVDATTGDSASYNTVVNNIARNNGKYGYREESDICQTTGCGSHVGNNTFENNDTYSNSSGNYFIFGGSDTNSGDLTSDPLNIDYTDLDMHLQSTSPMINAGVSLDAPSNDFDGNSRPSGSGYDVGAYEFAAVTLSSLSVNNTTNASKWSLQMNNLATGDTQFGDRTYTLTTVPSSLHNISWVRTANSSRSYSGNPIVSFSISRASTIAIGLDTRISPIPSWLNDGTWTKLSSGMNIVNNESSPKTFNLYTKVFPAGTVSLNSQHNSSGDMYMILAY